MTELKKHTLLVADDDDELRDILCMIFESSGFNVLSAHSGSSAYELVKKNHVDLIISDMCMADGDGMMLLEKVKSNNPDIPIVIFITGFTDVSSEECLRKGAKTIITKPFERQYLIKVVNEALGIS